MPDYIKPYQSQEIAKAPQAFSTDLPQVADAGASFQNLGRSILQNAEPFARERAQTKAIEDAGNAKIIRTPEGGYARANVTTGGGLVYSQAFDQALDEKQLNIMSADYAEQVSNYATRLSYDATDPHFRDPKAFFSFASGQAQGMLEAAPPSIRAALDSQLTRQLSQFVRGFSQDAAQANHKDLADGLRESYRAKLAEMSKVARSNADPDAVAQTMGTLRTEALGILDKLHNIGEIGDTAPYAEGLAADTFDENLLVASEQSMQGLGANWAKMSDEELRRMSYWGSHSADDGGKIGKMDFKGFRQLFPSTEVARQMGATAESILNDRIQAANAKALQDAANPPETAAQVLADHDALNYNAASGISLPQFAQFTREYDGHGTVAQQLRTGEGKLRTLGFLASTGAVPGGTNDALRAMAFSSDTESQQAALDFIYNARDVKTGSTWTGLQWFRNLPDDLKALAQFDGAMRRAGFNTTMELKTIFAKNQGRLTSVNDVMSYASGGDPTKYDGKAYSVIAKEFGVKPSELGPMAGQMKDDFTRYMQINAGLYATPEAAMQASAAMLATGWARSDVFVGGVGDARLVHEGIPNWFMDKALAHYPELRSGNPAGATFSNGRVKIQSMGESPTTGYPFYSFVYFNDQGQQLGRGAIYPMQRIVNAWHLYQQQTKAKADKAAMDAAPPPLWKLAHDPANGGKLRYVDNSAEVAAWQERQAKAPPQEGQAGSSVYSRENLARYGMVRY